MKTPKTVKGYLKMFVQIANEQSCDLNLSRGVTDEERKLIAYCRGAIQNELGDKEFKHILEKYGLHYP
jgi:hypothetical protein